VEEAAAVVAAEAAVRAPVLAAAVALDPLADRAAALHHLAPVRAAAAQPARTRASFANISTDSECSCTTRFPIFLQSRTAEAVAAAPSAPVRPHRAHRRWRRRRVPKVRRWEEKKPLIDQQRDIWKDLENKHTFSLFFDVNLLWILI
jgi:hypothetical protein